MPRPLPSLRLARFKGFELDLRAGELRAGTERIRLQGKPFWMMRLLLENAGEVVTREEIQKALWPGGTVVEFDHGIATALKKLRRALGDDAANPRYIETLARRGYRWMAGVEWVQASPVDDGLNTTNPSRQAIESIAVLPFTNMGGDSNDEYFSEGLSEEILNALTQVPGLKVIARTSSFGFKGKNQDIRKIAEALGVTNLLEGSVRRTGDRLRVTAQLIHATDGAHRWSQKYDRDVGDVFAVQDEIATAIAAAMKIELTAQSARGRPYEPNLPAYEAFLKARHHWGRLFLKTAEEQGARIEEYFKKAIILDPNWADPYSGLGQLYFYWASGPRPSEMIQLARAEAGKALELLPSEPLAHAVLGAVAAVHDYDWKTAGEHFNLARACESLSPWVHNMYAGCYLSPLGRFEEALQQAEEVIARDPLNTHYRATQLRTLLFAEMYDRAIIEAWKELEFDVRHIAAHSLIALAYFFQGKLAEAREWAEEAFHRTPLNPLAAGLLAGLMKQKGENEQAEATLRGMSPQGAFPRGMLIYHVVCSEIDAAIDVYERAIEQHNAIAAMWASAGFLKPLRSSLRWPKLGKMMNLPDRQS